MSTLPIDSVMLHSEGAGPPLVLLHPLGVDHHLWDAHAPMLAKHFRVLRHDFPGHGASPLPAGAYTIEDLSAQLGALLRRAGVGRVHLAGMSLGGLVAQHFAAANPGAVDQLVLADTTARYVDEMRAMWVVRAREARAGGTASLTEGILKIWFTAECLARNPPEVRYVRECFARTSGEAYARACEALGAADLRPLVPGVRAPTLVVCGDQDIPSFLDAARWLQSTIPGARLEWLSPAKHASPLEHPAEFTRLVEGFLLGKP